MDESRSPFDPPQNSAQPESGSGDAASATGIFGKPPKAPHPPQEDLLASLMAEREAAPTQNPPAKAAPDAGAQGGAAPGDFTRMLQSLRTPATGSAGVQSSQDLANIFKRVPVEPTQAASGSPADQARPFAATQPRAALPEAPQQNRQQPLSPPAPASSGDSAGPGNFTQMFRSRSEQPAVPPAASPAAAEEHAPGEFTRLFQAIPSNPRQASSPAPAPLPEPPRAADAPASFTQLFAAAAPPRQEQPSPLISEGRPQSGFTFSSAPPREPEPMTPAQGGFTQLFQALGKEQPLAAPPVEKPFAPSAAAPAAPAVGGFTQLLQSLSAQPGAAPIQPAGPPLHAGPVASPAASSAGPGEFTRVIASSALRAGHAGESLPAPGPAPSAAPRTGLPPMPPAPPMPHAAMLHPAPPQAAPPLFAFPAPPAPAPQPAPAPGPTGLQKHLPLILVINVFLLLLIAIILVLVLRHR